MIRTSSKARMALATLARTKTLTSQRQAARMTLAILDNRVWLETLNGEVPVMQTPWTNVNASMIFKFKTRYLVIVRNPTCLRLLQCPNCTLQLDNITYRTCHLSKASAKGLFLTQSSLTMAERATRCLICSIKVTMVTEAISSSKISRTLMTAA